jgi:hypothetical protein
MQLSSGCSYAEKRDVPVYMQKTGELTVEVFLTEKLSVVSLEFSLF